MSVWAFKEGFYHGRCYHIRKSAFAYTFEPKLWVYSISSKDFLIVRIQNVCGKAVLICLIPLLAGVVYDGNICS